MPQSNKTDSREKRQGSRSNKAATERASSQQRRESSRAAKSRGLDPKPYAIAGIAVIILAAVAYIVYSNYITTPFPAFLGNFHSASRVALVVGYANLTQYANMAECSDFVVQTIAHTRNASTIDIFVLNKTTCYYSPTGLGHAINVSTQPSSACLNVARSEPSIYLNYSNTNSTTITPYHLYVYGNAAYMQKCGIATDLSS